jgi:hypothetical protein
MEGVERECCGGVVGVGCDVVVVWM